MSPSKTRKVKAFIIGDGKWATQQMLVYKTKKAATQRVYNGGMGNVWKVYPCTISFTLPAKKV